MLLRMHTLDRNNTLKYSRRNEQQLSVKNLEKGKKKNKNITAIINFKFQLKLV